MGWGGVIARSTLGFAGFLFEMLVGKSSHSLQEYPKFFAVFAAIYVIEPLLTRVYIKNMCAAGEKVRCTHCSHLHVSAEASNRGL